MVDAVAGMDDKVQCINGITDEKILGSVRLLRDDLGKSIRKSARSLAEPVTPSTSDLLKEFEKHRASAL